MEPLSKSVKTKKVVIVTTPDEDELDISSDFDVSSDADDKTNPNYWNQPTNNEYLPENVRNAIAKSASKSKHSDFYYRLRNLNEKIKIYTDNFYDKVPFY